MGELANDGEGFTVRELALMRIEEVKREMELCREKINDDENVMEAKRKLKRFEKELNDLQQMV